MSLVNLVGRRVRNGDKSGEIYEIEKNGERIIATVLTDDGVLVLWDAKSVIFEIKDKQREYNYTETSEKMILG
jgi:hypothetical protein